MIAFGPVPSRRLGKSLGINNIIPGKQCSYSCIYCQIGNTKVKRLEREEFYEPEIIFREVEEHLGKLDQNHTPDYLSFVPNGEPTLDINLGKEIRWLKAFHIPLAVITNGSLLYRSDVRNDLMYGDLISVKADAATEEIWRKINHPVERLNFRKYQNGVKRFADYFSGKLVTETMLVSGINDTVEHIRELASFLADLQPDIAYIAVPVRPPAVKSVKIPSEEILNRAYQLFTAHGLKTEILTGFEGTNTGFTGNAWDDILNITAVHPLREDSIRRLLRQDKADFNIVESLIEQGLLEAVAYNGERFYLRKYHIL
ncbi:MAG: radical SAM protein [Bacteroides sp. SM23_62_1]|nr:MAG: radical SAM protein [Bacteroides sp. SM23_62_1]